MFAFLVFAGSTFAQRVIDWSISEVFTPTELLSNEQSGTQIPVHMALKNNGTATAKTGDTLVYQIVIADQNNNGIIFYPSSTTLATRILSRDVAANDTIHLRVNLSAQIFARNSLNVNFLAVCYLWNRGGTDPIQMESDNANNRTTKSITWWNPYKNGVGIKNVANGKLLQVYPNPANNEVTVNWPLASTGSAATINITDINGKVVESKIMNNFTGNETINVSSLHAGLYFVEIATADVKMTEKIQIVR